MPKKLNEFLNEGYNWATVSPHFHDLQKKVGFDQLSAVSAAIESAVPKPKYIRKMTEFFAKNQIHKIEDIGTTAKEVFGRYHFLKGRGVLVNDHADIDKVKSFDDLRGIVDSPHYSHLKQSKREKKAEFSTVLDNDEVSIHIPDNVQASSDLARCKVSGKKAAWCTAIEENPGTFEGYSGKSGGLHILIPKKQKHPGEMYQWSPGRMHEGSAAVLKTTGYKMHNDEEIKDENDDEVSANDMIKRFPKSGFSIQNDELFHSTLTPASDERAHEKFQAMLKKPELSDDEAQTWSEAIPGEHVHLLVPKLKAYPGKVHYFTHPHYFTFENLGAFGVARATDQKVYRAMIDRVERGDFHPSVLGEFASSARDDVLQTLHDRYLHHFDPAKQKTIKDRLRDPESATTEYHVGQILTGDKVNTPSGPGHALGYHGWFKQDRPEQLNDTIHPTLDPSRTTSILLDTGKVVKHNSTDISLAHSYDEYDDIPEKVRRHMDNWKRANPDKSLYKEDISTAKHPGLSRKERMEAIPKIETPSGPELFVRNVVYDSGRYKVGTKVYSKQLGHGKVVQGLGDLIEVDYGDGQHVIEHHSNVQPDLKLVEDVAVNCVGGGAGVNPAVAGIGVGPKGEPGVKKRADIDLVTHILRRKLLGEDK